MFFLVFSFLLPLTRRPPFREEQRRKKKNPQKQLATVSRLLFLFSTGARSGHGGRVEPGASRVVAGEKSRGERERGGELLEKNSKATNEGFFGERATRQHLSTFFLSSFSLSLSLPLKQNSKQMVTPSKADEEAALQSKHITVGEEERGREREEEKERRRTTSSPSSSLLCVPETRFAHSEKKKKLAFLKPPSLPHSPTPPPPPPPLPKAAW